MRCVATRCLEMFSSCRWAQSCVEEINLRAAKPQTQNQHKTRRLTTTCIVNQSINEKVRNLICSNNKQQKYYLFLDWSFSICIIHNCIIRVTWICFRWTREAGSPPPSGWSDGAMRDQSTSGSDSEDSGVTIEHNTSFVGFEKLPLRFNGDIGGEVSVEEELSGGVGVKWTCSNSFASTSWKTCCLTAVFCRANATRLRLNALALCNESSPMWLGSTSSDHVNEDNIIFAIDCFVGQLNMTLYSYYYYLQSQQFFHYKKSSLLSHWCVLCFDLWYYHRRHAHSQHAVISRPSYYRNCKLYMHNNTTTTPHRNQWYRKIEAYTLLTFQWFNDWFHDVLGEHRNHSFDIIGIPIVQRYVKNDVSLAERNLSIKLNLDYTIKKKLIAAQFITNKKDEFARKISITTKLTQ